MRRVIGAVGAAGIAFILLVPAVFAAGPASSPGARGQGQTSDIQANDVAAAVLGLTVEQVRDLRQDGLSLAQIAAQQKVDANRVVQALVARWSERIDVRVQNGGLTSSQATALKTQLQARAEAYVAQTEPGGMAGAAVGAGPGGAGRAAGAGSGSATAGARIGPGPRGTGTGTGVCDGTGPHGPGRP